MNNLIIISGLKNNMKQEKCCKYCEGLNPHEAHYCPCHSSPKVASWEEGFDKKFIHHLWKDLIETGTKSNDIKSFISSTIKEEREKIFKEFESYLSPNGYDSEIGKGLREVLLIIKSKYE